MKWPYWIQQYIRMHCVARGLQPTTMAAYEATLVQFRKYVAEKVGDVAPDQIRARDVLAYVQHLRQVRVNGSSAVNRAVTILSNFYRAMVAMGHLDFSSNPMADFPSMKGTPRKLPVVLSNEETERLLSKPNTDTVIGLRDRAMIALLYGTGIRASECATLREADVDLDEMTVTVIGKGGHQRTVPLNEQVAASLEVYRRVRGRLSPSQGCFRSLRGRAMSRNAIYERVRTWARRAGIRKIVSPHRLRHTFATHLSKAGVALVTIRDLLGHRLITSTQIYLHVTCQDLREAAEKHPIGRLARIVAHILPDVRLPIQHAPA